MTNRLQQNYPQFFELNGTALNDGYVYIGIDGLNPETNPISVFLDATLSTPISQPLRTTGGYIYYNGSPVSIYFGSSNYSITVKNSLNTLIYTNLSAYTMPFVNTAMVVENIEELKTFNIQQANQIETLGYYEKGDGGGGLFYWDLTSTEDDNGGTIIQATGIAIGRWKRCIEKYTRPKDYGITDNEKSLTSCGAVIRKAAGTNTNWNFINDAEHQPISFDTISTTNSYVDVSISNNSYLGETGSVLCGLDETYATHGLFVGASVSSSLARVKIAKHIRGLLKIGTGEISCPAVSTDNFYGEKDSTGITITHPEIIDGAKVTFTPRNFGNEADKIYIESETTTSTRIIPLKTIELIATKTAGAWTFTTGSTALNSALSGILTISEVGAVITINHPASFFGTVHHITTAPVYKSSTEFSQLTIYTPTISTQTKANLRYKAGIPVDSVDGDQFRIVFHDLIWLVGGEVTVDLGVVQLDPIKDLANISSGANIWIHGTNWAK